MLQIVAFARRVVSRASFMLALSASLQYSDAATLKVLYSFTGGSDGGSPNAALIMDTRRDLYGTTYLVNGYTAGTVFKLSRNGVETVLHTFVGGTGGSQPGGLFMDAKGSLWGTTCCGGNANGCGVVFRITAKGDEKLVHTFTGEPNDGCTAFAALITGRHKNFYGTTTGGGKDNEGSVFKMAQSNSEVILHSFGFQHGGNYPLAGLLLNASGNFLGVDEGGGAKKSGTVFELDPNGREKVLYAFKGAANDGSEPDGTLIADLSGNLYGTLLIGGRAGCEGNEGCGAVFELAPDGTETILHFFTGKKGDGGNPVGGVIADGAGNLYGTTNYGGGPCSMDIYGCGTAYKIGPDGSETILFSFSKSDGTNGAYPIAGLLLDGFGNLYGTARGGGAYGYGTVFEITP